MEKIIYTVIRDGDYWTLYVLLQKGIAGYILPVSMMLCAAAMDNARTHLYIGA